VRHLPLRHPPLLRKSRLVVATHDTQILTTHFILRRMRRKRRRRMRRRMPRPLSLVVVSLLVLVTFSRPSPRLRLPQLLRLVSIPLRSMNLLPLRPSRTLRKLPERHPPLKLRLPSLSSLLL